MVCWDVEEHGCLGFHMGGINICGRIKQSFYPRTRHGELKVISMIYAPPLPYKKIGAEGEVDRTLASSPTVTPRAHKAVNTRKQSTSKHSITTEHHTIKKASHDTATRYGSVD